MARPVIGLIVVVCAIGLATWFWLSDRPRYVVDVEQSTQVAERGDEMLSDESRSRGFRRGSGGDLHEGTPDQTSRFSTEERSSPGGHDRAPDSRRQVRRPQGDDSAASEDDSTRSGKVLGRVLDGSGRPVLGALVVARPLHAQGEHLIEYEGFTQNGGHFLIDGIQPGDYQIQAKSPYSDSESRPVRVRTGPESIDLLIPDIYTLRVFGVVRNTEGDPISGVSVRALLPNAKPASSDTNGQYSMTVHVQSDHTASVQFEHEAFRSRREAIPRHLEQAEIEVSVELERLGSLVVVGGMLLNEESQPVSGKRVNLRDSANRYRATSDANGIFVFPAVEGGKTYQLSVPSDDSYKHYVRNSFWVPREDLLDVAIDLTSRGEGEINGIVTDRRGMPIPGFELRVSVDHFNESLRTDASGRFYLDQVPEGRVRISTSSQPRFVTSGAQVRSGQRLDVHAELDIGEKVMEGRVVDELGMPVGNARVSLSWVARAEGITHESLRQSITDDEGWFSFSGFGPGSRTLIVNAEGFQQARMTVQADARPVIELAPSS